ncbi:ABC transporter ATP-binding protein [Erysipelothrix anatis]|uniref:ABC transporter ATP-binding protein n=1 Tax=Erysipelothrix anatis TaxID=2683713 RepID=UPI001358983A|nr:ABC transporter ATP-binding protein [Erysipelothrix anatis]
MLKLLNISKKYDDGRTNILALNNVTLSLPKGTFAAIVGPSGSGKSTLLTIMGALQRPTEGTIELDGVDIYDVSEKERSKIRFEKLGFVLQASNLVPFLTVEEQFFFKLSKSKRSDSELYETLLNDLNISHLKRKYPEELSGGERQRVAIALSLILKPEIILADEPTASLDTEKAFDVVRILKDMTRTLNTTVVMVTHDRRLLSDCDIIFEITDGNLEVKMNKKSDDTM